MKKVKVKKWMIQLIILTILIIPLNKAQARTIYTEQIPGQVNGVLDIPDFTTNEYERVVNFTTAMMRNQGLGDGFILFNMYEQANVTQNYVNWVSEVVVEGTDSAPYTCELTEVVGWIDNPKQTNYRQVKCYMNVNNGIKRIRLKKFGSGYGTSTVRLGGYITFVGDNNTSVNVNVNQQAVVNEIANQGQLTIDAIEDATQEVVEEQQNTSNKVQDLIDQDLQEWDEWKNTDISENAKQQPSQQNYDSVHTFEEGIFSDLEDPNILALIDIGIDTNTNNWIWNTMTGIFNANVRVMSMVISVLTLGLAKFLMGR